MTVPYITTLPAVPPRPEESHKGTFGRVLIVAGSRGMSGAACLAGLGALRGGAGLVTLAVPRGILPIIAAIEPSYLTVPLPEDDAGRISRHAVKEILALVEKSTAVAIGPGWGTSPDLVDVAHTLYSSIDKPLVIDADGLNALVGWAAAATEARWAQPTLPPRVLTPHPGEFARLLRTDTAVVQKDRESLAAEFAKRHKVVLILKGHASVVTDGERIAINTTGNSGMATGGTGDVLTGLLAALLAQGMPPFDASHLAAHLHGLAGDLAAADLTRPALIASDLPAYLPRAWKQMGAT